MGAHEGQTLAEVTKPRYGFERICAFEPMPRQFRILFERFGHLPNVRLFPYGLNDKTGLRYVYGSNEAMEASLFKAKRDADESIVTECMFVSASDSLAGMSEASVVMKLNCEGAEIPILHDLIDSGQIRKVANVMIDFDIRKVTGLEEEEARVLARLEDIGFDRYALCENVMFGQTHQERIAHWLDGLELHGP